MRLISLWQETAHDERAAAQAKFKQADFVGEPAEAQLRALERELAESQADVALAVELLNTVEVA